MLVKLAFVMQRLKKISEKFFVMINKDGGGGTIFLFYGGHSCYEGDIELMGVPPVPPTKENLGVWFRTGKNPHTQLPSFSTNKSALEYSFNHYFLLIHCINITSTFWGSVCRLIILNNFTERLYKTSNDFFGNFETSKFWNSENSNTQTFS